MINTKTSVHLIIEGGLFGDFISNLRNRIISCVNEPVTKSLTMTGPPPVLEIIILTLDFQAMML